MIGSSVQAAMAAAVVVAWLALCVLTERAARRRAARAMPASATGLTVLVVHASQTGVAEEVAEATARALQAGGVATRVVALGELDTDTLRSASLACFVASTTGEGDPPDSAAAFMAVMEAMPPPALTSLRYGLLALGDHEYANFCAFGHALDAWLAGRGAQRVFESIDVDNVDPAALDRWYRSVRLASGMEADAPVEQQAFAAVELLTREHVNPDSPGGRAYCLRFARGDLAWEAGDIAVVAVGDGEHAPTREYSIASVPDEGLVLLVREMRGPDGTPGVGSAHLLHAVRPGDRVRVRVRRNRSFHAPPDARALLLVGNGTGIAGLRALLAQRARAGRQRNWLVFGERTRAHDLHFGEDLARWREDGTLARADFAFSREGAGRTYVQHVLARNADAVRAWVAGGAAIYVCGSRIGMAPAVHDALEDILGEGTLDRLRRADRYRRDVY